jgi:hypothetical protein
VEGIQDAVGRKTGDHHPGIPPEAEDSDPDECRHDQ